MKEKTKEIRLHEGELNVMELLWSNKALAAKDIAKIIKEYIGWEKNTTYTVIKRLMKKGAIVREDPGFICRANISKNKVREIEMRNIMEQLFDNSMESFLVSYLAGYPMTNNEVSILEAIVNKKKGKI